MCIPVEKWADVLREASRVLTVGGRLELIDDHVFFPLGKSLTQEETTSPNLLPPRLDIPIPSSPFSSNTNDGETSPADSVVELYRNRRSVPASVATSSGSGPHASDAIPSTSLTTRDPRYLRLSAIPTPLTDLSHPWAQQASASRDLESLFESMLANRFGVHTRPSEFIPDVVAEVFTHVREVATLHLTLAPGDGTPPPTPSEGANPPEKARGQSSGQSRRPTASTTPSNATGLILWPSTFIPMPREEMEAHSYRNPRLLLSCRNNLVDYAREELNGEVDNDTMQEALWDYERCVLWHMCGHHFFKHVRPDSFLSGSPRRRAC